MGPALRAPSLMVGVIWGGTEGCSERLWGQRRWIGVIPGRRHSGWEPGVSWKVRVVQCVAQQGG